MRHYTSGGTIYAATSGGLSISTNGGGNWTNLTAANGLGNTDVRSVFASGSTIYVGAANDGLSISTNGGGNWTTFTNANGLGGNSVRGVFASGGTIYAATNSGLSISFSLPPSLYWLGSNGTLWSAGNNWSTDISGSPVADFAADSDIIFSATGSTNSTDTDLGGDLSIGSLTINSTAGISGGNLTVTGATTINPATINSSLNGGAGPAFAYETETPYRDSIFGGVGVSAKLGDRWSASTFYNVNFGGDGYTNNIISATLGFSF